MEQGSWWGSQKEQYWGRNWHWGCHLEKWLVQLLVLQKERHWDWQMEKHLG